MSWITLILTFLLFQSTEQKSNESDTWFDPSVWIDLGSGTYIGDDIWNDPDLVDWETCSKVLDDIETPSLDLPEMDVLNLPDIDSHHSGVTKQNLWPNAVIPTQLEPGMTIGEQKRLACAVTFFSEKTCIRFVKWKQSDTNYLVIKKTDSRPGCFSESLGMAGGKQVVNLDQRAASCWTHGTIIHELMHAVGFFHEQARNDRDQYIQVHWNEIPTAWHKQYKKGEELGVEQKLVGSYDYASVMHYRRYHSNVVRQPSMTALRAPIEDNNQAMGNRKAPTAMDALKINLLYACGEANRDCMVGQWKLEGPCKEGNQIIKRSVIQQPTGNGTACPELVIIAQCTPQAN